MILTDLPCDKINLIAIHSYLSFICTLKSPFILIMSPAVIE